ncbi:hypothetical protein STEG23_023928, partial [Scotinomys teguina]
KMRTCGFLPGKYALNSQEGLRGLQMFKQLDQLQGNEQASGKHANGYEIKSTEEAVECKHMSFCLPVTQ